MPSVRGRGRPRHAYQASVEAQKRLGQNYADLAVVLWEEMMTTVEDRKLRRLLFARITERLAEMYRGQVSGPEWEGRLVQLTSLLHDRGVEAEVARDGVGAFPMLRQHSCPYYELAETDRGICALERKMFEKVLGRGLAAQPVPARRRPLLRLPGQAGRRRKWSVVSDQWSVKTDPASSSPTTDELTAACGLQLTTDH